MVTPRYPVYVPSKGRYQRERALTVRFLAKEGLPFYVVAEPQETERYVELAGAEHVLTLPQDNGGLIFARNWIKEHATAAGAARHWQLDDNIGGVRRLYRGRRIPCDAGPALAVAEDFSDRYVNVGISGLNYQMFGMPGSPPYFLNVHVYSCTLINNAIPHRWRQRYNDDTDICLQVLADGWTTVLINTFLADKKRTMTISGGNTDDLYQGNGRLVMARSLERIWPHVVTTQRRFQRPQHVIRDSWRKFDTQLIPRPDLDLTALPPTDEYGLELHAVRDVRSPDLRKLLKGGLPSRDGLSPEDSTDPARRRADTDLGPQTPPPELP